MYLAGVDEAGRGPVIGPLVIGIVVVKREKEPELSELGVKDSKMLTPEEREALFDQIISIVDEWKIVQIPPKEIDALREKMSLNEIEAMKIGEALNSLKIKPSIVFVDAADLVENVFAERIGRYLHFKPRIVAKHKADAKYPVVSAASIIAKVIRDREIRKIEEELGVEIGSGYPGDERTMRFLREWIKKNGKLPDFARKSWKTAQDLFQTKLDKWFGWEDEKEKETVGE